MTEVAVKGNLITCPFVSNRKLDFRLCCCRQSGSLFGASRVPAVERGRTRGWACREEVAKRYFRVYSQGRPGSDSGALAVQLGPLAKVSPTAWGRTGTRAIPLVRDIFGNPFRPVTFDPRWRTSDVVGLAQAICDDKAFERMPILADALMDAGCEEEQLIGHCRGEGPPVRGCWVVDLVLATT